MSSKEPGKEWQITTPEGEDPIKLIQGELAIRGMVSALGWSITEIERPSETEVTYDEMRGISQDVFGDETYGNFAADYLKWMKYGATGQVLTRDVRHYYVNFSHSAFHFSFPTHESRLKVATYAAEADIEKATKRGLKRMPFPFTHDFHGYDRFSRPIDRAGTERVYLVADLIPTRVTRERLGQFLATSPADGAAAPKDHNFHGVIGRSLDVLCLVAGTKTTLDAATTEVAGDPVPYKEFKSFALREGVSTSALHTLDDKLNNAARHQLLHGRLESWGEVILQGNSSLRPSPAGTGFRKFSFDQISVSTLAAVKKSYTGRTSPKLLEVLSAYE